jgi:hypothetical protein
LTDVRTALIAEYYSGHTTDINGVFDAFTHFYEQIKTAVLTECHAPYQA